MKNLALNPENKESIMEFLQKPYLPMAEAITGLLASEKKNWALIAGRLVQGAIKVDFFNQLGEEIKELRDKGKIKKDFFSTANQKASLLELLKFIDNDASDENIFKAMKSIFFSTIAEDASEKEELLGYQLLKICKNLGSGEVMTLKAAYEIYSKKDGRSQPSSSGVVSADSWLNDISETLNLPKQIIELFENKLIDLKLLSGRTFGDMSGIRPQNFRLTDLGLKMCEFIMAFNNISEKKNEQTTR